MFLRVSRAMKNTPVQQFLPFRGTFTAKCLTSVTCACVFARTGERGNNRSKCDNPPVSCPPIKLFPGDTFKVPRLKRVAGEKNRKLEERSVWSGGCSVSLRNNESERVGNKESVPIIVLWRFSKCSAPKRAFVCAWRTERRVRKWLMAPT